MMTGGLNTAGGRTVHSTITGNSLPGTTVIAIVEGKGQARGEVGIASLDLCLPIMAICQFHDSQDYAKVLTKVNIFNPVEVVMSSTVCEDTGEPSRLYLQIRKEFPHVPVLPIPRKMFDDAVGIQRLQNIIHREYEAVLYTVSQKYFGLAAVAAVLKYIEVARNIIFATHTLKVEFQLAEKTMMIDFTTSQHLELIRNNLNSKSTQSLFGVVNHCRTPGGARVLRTNILQPICDTAIITRRLDCIQELRNNPIVLYSLMDVLNSFPQDMEQVLATLIHIPKTESNRILEQRINYIIFLKQILNCLPMLAETLSSCHHHFFHSARQEFLSDKFTRMQVRIQTVINEEAKFSKGGVAMRMQRSFAINQNLNPLLDIARKALLELQGDAQNYVNDLAAVHQMNFRLMENSTRGYYILYTIPSRPSEAIQFPQNFLNLTRKNNSVTFTTEPLLVTEQRISKLIEEIHNISIIVITELLNDIRKDIGHLYRASDAISELDVLYALTNYTMASLGAVTRPEFSANYTAIKNGRHPILDAISPKLPIGNNLYMSCSHNMALITGPNMSGKTTVLKQFATLQVLAQIGSFVPAESATFLLTTQIFSRIGNGDKIDEHASSFVLEMREMNYILENMTPRSLVIVDELGRSTSVEEGTSISWAMVESMMKKEGLVLFATHYLTLTRMEAMYPNVLNYKMDTVEVFVSGDRHDADSQPPSTPANQTISQQVRNSRLNYTYVLRRGVTDIEHYGLKLAKNSSFSASIIERSMAIADEMKSERRTGASTSKSSADSVDLESVAQEFSRKRSLYNLGSHLYMLSSSEGYRNMSRWELINYLQNLQEEFNVTVPPPPSAVENVEIRNEHSEDDSALN